MIMFRKFSLVVLFVINGVIASGIYRYDYTYNKETSGWLKLHRRPATFTEAFMRCDLEGAVLASPLNAKIQRAVLEAASDVDCAIFTGIHATISKGDFTSIEGVPLAKIPLKWAVDEPDNFENQEDCIIMLPNGTVADERCNNTYPYVCYRKKTTRPVITACGTVDNGYNLNQQTGSCYKFHQTAKIWRRAQMTCLAEGGHLAIINSQDEATFLKHLFDKYPANSIRAQYPNSAHVGFLDWDKNSSWYTVNGQSLEAAGHTGWYSGRPSNLNQGRHCGSLERVSGKLDDFWCESVPSPFICEKTPDSLLVNDEEWGNFQLK